MKKTIVLALSAAFILSSCGSYTATGAYTGSTLGSVLGSAIGGLSGGPRGSDWGQIIGMAGGAVIGGAIGNAADNARERKLEGYHERVLQKYDSKYADNNRDDSGFDPSNRADDRIDIDLKAPTGDVPSIHEKDLAPKVPDGKGYPIQISRVTFEDNNNVLESNEQRKIVFELRNLSQHTVRHVKPMVKELTGNKHIMVSPGIEVESIAPGSGIRYTAAVVADKKLGNGKAEFQITVQHDGQFGAVNTEYPDVISIPTRR
jgi:hypothetical protein